MELPFASMFILKLFLLSLMLNVVTSNSKPTTPTNNNKLFSDICPETKNPKLCFDILSLDRRTRLAPTLFNLGLGSLGIAIPQAKFSVSLFTTAYNKKYLPKTEKEKCKVCLGNYTLAVKKLGEAKAAFIIRNYTLAEKNIEVVHEVPISCEKELVTGRPSPIFAGKRVNEMPEITFDIALLIVQKLDLGPSNFDRGY